MRRVRHRYIPELTATPAARLISALTLRSSWVFVNVSAMPSAVRAARPEMPLIAKRQPPARTDARRIGPSWIRGTARRTPKPIITAAPSAAMMASRRRCGDSNLSAPILRAVASMKACVVAVIP